MPTFENLEQMAAFVAECDGGHNKSVQAFIKEDGSFGGQSPWPGQKGIIKQTTMIKYTRWKYGLIESNEL